MSARRGSPLDACPGPVCAGARPRSGRHWCRGMCRGCYERVERAGRLDDYPAIRTPSPPGLVADALELRRECGRAEVRAGGRGGGARVLSGISWDEVAARLGVAPRALEKARERAGWPDA